MTTKMCKCDNCDWTGTEYELSVPVRLLENLYKRVDAGGTVPAGTCPACGCLAYHEPATSLTDNFATCYVLKLINTQTAHTSIEAVFCDRDIADEWLNKVRQTREDKGEFFIEPTQFINRSPSI